MTRIAIIGGGAAGMMAAASICEASPETEVLLFEGNSHLGHKVIISGGGRCNVTTGYTEPKNILKNYPRGAQFLRTALYAFPPLTLREWIEAHGVPLKEEADRRVFPKSNKGHHIVGIFERILEAAQIELKLKTKVESIEKDGSQFKITCKESTFLADKVILTTGGQAYRHTGSQGDGYAFAEALGHSITKLGPSLNSLILKEQWVRDRSGLSFEKVKLKFAGKEKFEFSGPILFTHRGVSGPAVFALSSYAAFEHFEKNKPAELFIDFFPDENYEELRKRFQKHFAEEHKKHVHNSLGYLTKKSLAEGLCETLKINPQKRNDELSKKEQNLIIESLKNLKLTIIGRAAGDEFVTAGGVETSEVNPKSMESKLCPGLYFAGEILNVDGFTGGFNLHAAWCMGRLAGLSAVKEK
jgi:predicted Rossmann fold flavoprotein